MSVIKWNPSSFLLLLVAFFSSDSSVSCGKEQTRLQKKKKKDKDDAILMYVCMCMRVKKHTHTQTASFPSLSF